MELRQLEYFVAVAGEMNFSRAAQQVHVVQSALSMSIGKLEKELGIELFDRSKQQIKLTPAGELFRDHARRVIHTARLAKDSVSEYRGALSGTVALGCLVSFGKLDVPKILGEFHREYPFVQIRLRQSQTGSVTYLSAIADGSLDLALLSAPARFPVDIEMQLLSEEPMLFVCRPDHHLAQRDRVSVAELGGEDMIGFPSEFGLQRIVEEAFTAAGVTHHKPNEAPVDYWIGASLIRHGLGSMFMPASDAGRFPDLRALSVRPVMQWKIYLAKKAHVTPPATKLAELLLVAGGMASRR